MNKKTYTVTIIFMAIILVAICAVCLVRVKGLENQLNSQQDSVAVAAVERDEMAAKLEESVAKLAESESYVGAIRTERDAVNNVLTSIQTERDAANESLEAVQAERDAANAIAEAAKTERDILYKRLSEAYDRIIELETQLGIEPTVSALSAETAVQDIPAITEQAEEPAVEATEEPAPEATEEPAPEVTEEPAPEATEVPAEENKEEAAQPKPGH